MGQRDDPPKLTEPEIVHCLFCTGLEIEATEHFVRFVAWVDLPVVGEDNPERRVVARLVMPPQTARLLSRDLRIEISRGGH